MGGSSGNRGLTPSMNGSIWAQCTDPNYNPGTGGVHQNCEAPGVDRQRC